MKMYVSNFNFPGSIATTPIYPPIKDVKTFNGRSISVKTKMEFLKFFFEEKTLSRSFKNNSLSTKEFELYLDQISQSYRAKALSEELMEGFEMRNPLDIEQGESCAEQIASCAYLQVLEGNNSFYIGICISDSLVKSAIASLIEGTELIADQITLPNQPHVTFVPPSKKISPSFSLNRAKTTQLFDLTFNRISISKKGNVNIWVRDSDSDSRRFIEMSMSLAEVFDVEPTLRAPHGKVGVISKELTQAIFAYPKKFGFSAESSDGERLYKNIPPMLQPIGFSSQKFADEQIILKKRVKGANPVSNQDIIDSKIMFKQRAHAVKNQQEQLKNRIYRESKKIPQEERPFLWSKLSLALDGSDKLGRVPLTFSCRENGIQLWVDFCNDVKEVVEKYSYDDVRVQMLGSGVHGFTRNPDKDLKSWGYGSDGDIAIFSKKLSLDCAKAHVQVNESIQLHGRFVCYKNVRYEWKKGIGFHETMIGHEFKHLQKKWSIRLYGEDASTGTDIDFKVNINPIPFRDAINIY